MARTSHALFSCTSSLNTNKRAQRWQKMSLHNWACATQGHTYVVSAFPYLMQFYFHKDCLYFYMTAYMATCGHFHGCRYFWSGKSSSCTYSWNSSGSLKFIVRLKRNPKNISPALVVYAETCLCLETILCPGWYVKNCLFLKWGSKSRTNGQTKQLFLKHMCVCAYMYVL